MLASFLWRHPAPPPPARPTGGMMMMTGGGSGGSNTNARTQQIPPPPLPPNLKADAHGLLQSYFAQPLIAHFDDMFRTVQANDNTLSSFQRALREIPGWTADNQLASCMGRLRALCPYLDELIAALFLCHIKQISCIRNTMPDTVRVELPPREEFVHVILVDMAHAFYGDPKIFRRADFAAKASTANRAIEAAILRALPVQEILSAYLGSSTTADNRFLVLNSEFHGFSNSLTNNRGGGGGAAGDIAPAGAEVQQHHEQDEVAAPGGEDGPPPSSSVNTQVTAVSTAETGVADEAEIEEQEEEQQQGEGGEEKTQEEPSQSVRSSRADEKVIISTPPAAKEAFTATARKSGGKADAVGAPRAVESMSESVDPDTDRVVPLTDATSAKHSKKPAQPAKDPKKVSNSSSTNKAHGVVSMEKLSANQQNKLLGKILGGARSRQMLTPTTFFSSAESTSDK